MSLDETVDQLAFGKTTQKHGACLGLYLSPDTIYIAETRLEGGKVVVEHLVRVAIPAPAKTSGAASTLNTDFLMDNEKLVPLIRQSMSQIRWGSKEVMVTLSHHLGLLRYFTMPPVDRRFWRSAVPLEAKKYIPIPFDALSHDFHVTPLPPDASNKPRIGALIAVTQKKNLANVGGLLETLGLTMLGMEVAPCSVLRMWETLDKGSQGRTHCQVHFDGGNIRIVVADRGIPVFFRELFLGGEASVSDIRKVDLGGCVSFAQKQLGVGPLAQLRLSGAAGDLPHWQEALSSEVGVKAGVQDTAATLGIKGGDWGGFAAIGASIRFVAPSAAPLDLGRVGQITEDEHRTARNILVAGAAVAGYFAAAGLWGALMYQFKAGDLRSYARDAEIEAELGNRTEQDLNELIGRMRGQVEAVQGLGNEVPRVTALLKDIVDALPENVWLTKIDILNPLVRGEGELIQIELAGHAMAASMGEERDLAFRFRDNLSKSPLVGKNFPQIEVAVTGRPMEDSQNQQMDPTALQRRIQERTAFTLRCRQSQAKGQSE